MDTPNPHHLILEGIHQAGIKNAEYIAMIQVISFGSHLKREEMRKYVADLRETILNRAATISTAYQICTKEETATAMAKINELKIECCKLLGQALDLLSAAKLIQFAEDYLASLPPESSNLSIANGMLQAKKDELEYIAANGCSDKTFKMIYEQLIKSEDSCEDLSACPERAQRVSGQAPCPERSEWTLSFEDSIAELRIAAEQEKSGRC